jgi:hypothetical protein
MLEKYSSKKTEKVRQVFVVLEIYSDWVRSTKILLEQDGSFLVDFSETKNAPNPILPGWQSDAVRDLVSSLGQIPEVSFLVIFDRGNAVVSQQGIVLPRPDWNAEITDAELEGAIRHGIWKTAQYERAVSARALGVHELQIRLADVDLLQMKVDGHRVMSPLGFRGNNIECVLREVFVKADIWNQITLHIPAEKIISVTERSGFWAGHVASVLKQDGVFLDTSKKEVLIYRIREGGIEYKDKVKWGSDDFYGYIVKQFGLSNSWAEKLIAYYVNGNCSYAMKKAIEDVLASEYSMLLHSIESAKEGRSVPVFIHDVVPLPRLELMPHLLSRLGQSALFTHCDINFLSGSSAPVVHYNQKLEGGIFVPSFDTAISAISRFLAGGNETLLGKTARQRVRWTASQG